MTPHTGKKYSRAILDLNSLSRVSLSWASYLLRRLMSLVALGSSTWNL